MSAPIHRHNQHPVAHSCPPAACTSMLWGAVPQAIRAASEATNRVGIACTTDAAAAPQPNSLLIRPAKIQPPDDHRLAVRLLECTVLPASRSGPVRQRGRHRHRRPQHAAGVSIAFPASTPNAPAQPGSDGTGRITSLTTSAAATNGSVTYQFVAGQPGTYLYESGTDPETQVRMGLFGALIIRPTAGADHAYDRPDSVFNPATEFLALLSEIDPNLSSAVQHNRVFNMNTYHPRYWLINGRGFLTAASPTTSRRGCPASPTAPWRRSIPTTSTWQTGSPSTRARRTRCRASPAT